MAFAVCIFMISFVFYVKGQNQYCQISRQQDLCRFKPGEMGPECNGAAPQTVTNAQKQEIVNTHNELRRRVATGNVKQGLTGSQPSASNMRMLVRMEINSFKPTSFMPEVKRSRK